MIQQNMVVLVGENGCDLLEPDGTPSTMEKIEAHQHGLLHRAVSVFIFNDFGQLLLQKLAATKYHSPEKWSNTCCTHPLPGEMPTVAAERRLAEEMGLEVPLVEVFTFSYKVEVGNSFIENEFDHVFFGFCGLNNCTMPGNVQRCLLSSYILILMLFRQRSKTTDLTPRVFAEQQLYPIEQY